jgi:hypothetical protein
MGKKFITIQINTFPYRVYLNNLHKVYKVVKKTLPQIPVYQRKNSSRKESLETVPDGFVSFEDNDI